MTAATCPACLGLFGPLKGGGLCPEHRAARLRAIAERTSRLDDATASLAADPDIEPCQTPPTTGRAP